MENRFKFRAWDWNKIIYNLMFKNSGGFSTYELLFDEEYWDKIIEIITLKNIMQYTWLKDKNWKEIYDGDIISFPYITPFWDIDDNSEWDRKLVEFKNWMYWFANKTRFIPLESYINKEDWQYISNAWNKVVYKDFIWIIIWNIYENPELLKK